MYNKLNTIFVDFYYFQIIYYMRAAVAWFVKNVQSRLVDCWWKVQKQKLNPIIIFFPFVFFFEQNFTIRAKRL